MDLNADNYYSREADAAFMSVSQYKKWMQCPAEVVAHLAGTWTRLSKAVFLVGNYMDKALLTPHLLEAWWQDNLPALRQFSLVSKAAKTLDQKNADLREIDAIITAISELTVEGSSEMFADYLKGNNQEIIEFEMFGIPWKCALDTLNLELGRIVDLKSVRKDGYEHKRIERGNILSLLAKRNGERVYQPYASGPYYEVMNYWLQGAVYIEAVEWKYDKRLPLLLASLTKAEYPNALLTRFNPENPTHANRFQRELNDVEKNLHLINAWKDGSVEAPRCELCEFCASSRGALLIDAVDHLKDTD